MPPQWLGAYLRMCPKILQGHIARVHLGLVQPLLMLPHLQAMYYGEDSFLMNSLSPLTTIELHALMNNGHPTCVNNLPNGKITCPRIHLKRFVKSCKLEHGWRKQLVLKPPKAWCQSSSHSWDSHVTFFNKSGKVIEILEKNLKGNGGSSRLSQTMTYALCESMATSSLHLP